MALDLEALLAPVEGEDPAGPDLSYDNDRVLIDQAFERSVSIDTSGAEVESAEIDWRPIISAIESQSAQTKDVWLAVYLARAGARAGRLDTVELGLDYLGGLLDRFWDSVHPKLEDYGVQGRAGACESLARLGEFVAPLARAPLLEHPRLGRFGAADFERFKTNSDAEGYGLFRAALDDTPDEDIAAAIDRLDRIAAALKVVDSTLTQKSEGEAGVNFQPAYEALARFRQAVQSFARTPIETPADSAADVGGEAPARASFGAPTGRLETREEVVRALDAIIDYYRRKEPASPTPLMLDRVREWVTSDFISIVEDLLPGSLEEARRMLISERKRNEFD